MTIHVAVTFCWLKLFRNFIAKNSWNSKRMVDYFCFNLSIDRWITNWYYSNKYICDCGGHLYCLMITLKVLKCVIGTTSRCIFLHVNIQIITCIFIVFIIQQYNDIIYQCNTLFFYPKHLTRYSKYHLDQVNLYTFVR